MIRKYEDAFDNEYCYIPSNIPKETIKIASTFLNDYCKNVIISNLVL